MEIRRDDNNTTSSWLDADAKFISAILCYSFKSQVRDEPISFYIYTSPAFLEEKR